VNLTKYHYACVAGGIIKEIKRRQAIVYDPRANTDKEIIAAIKDRIPVVDVLEWYTDVFYASRDQGRFRCTLHGEDKNPSGVIYRTEARWWCFGCNKGGDVFDAVQAFEKTDLPHAIAKLARYIGLDTKPLIRKPVLQVRGGAVL
jgi:DNA primase